MLGRPRLGDRQGRDDVTGRAILAAQQVEDVAAMGIGEGFERRHAAFVSSNGYIAIVKYTGSSGNHQTKIGRQGRGRGGRPAAAWHIAVKLLCCGLGRDDRELTVVGVRPGGSASLAYGFSGVREHAQAVTGALDTPSVGCGTDPVFPRMINTLRNHLHAALSSSDPPPRRATCNSR